MSSELIKIDTLDGFVELVKNKQTTPFSNSPSGGEIYCPKCGRYQNTFLTELYGPHHYGGQINFAIDIKEQFIPSLLRINCVNCDSAFTAFIFNSPNGAQLAIIPPLKGGVATPNTPDGVAYYLDQAQGARSIGANSAAVAMFRAALEHLLFEQGYPAGMLNSKITKLIADISTGSAPKWALNMETDYLQMLQKLGNGSIHPNDGNIAQQATIDNELLTSLNEFFGYLLYIVYDSEIEKQQRLAMFKAKAKILSK